MARASWRAPLKREGQAEAWAGRLVRESRVPDPLDPLTTPGTPAAERSIDETLVRQLLRDQHPDLADAALRPIDSGWDNAMFRLGEEYAVRLPRRELAVAFLRHEQEWLPGLAQVLPVPVPTPLRTGRPSERFPWPWSIVPWLPGQTADVAPPASQQARPLADFLRALHRPAPANAPANGLRGVPLRKRAADLEARLDRLGRSTDRITPEIERVWQRALSAPETTRSDWLHGDLHPRNVLVQEGAITGIVDWGDVTAGDVATDLASVWMLLGDAGARDECLRQYGASPEQRARAEGWAVFFGAVLLDSGLVDDPRHAAVGEATLRRLAEDAIRE